MYFPPLLANVVDLQAVITIAVVEDMPDKLHLLRKQFIIYGIFVVPHLEVASNCNSDTSDKA